MNLSTLKEMREYHQARTFRGSVRSPDLRFTERESMLQHERFVAELDRLIKSATHHQEPAK